MAEFTKGALSIHRAKTPDNTGGFDYSIVDADGKIIAETFEHVGFSDNRRTYDIRPAEANARLFSKCGKMLVALEVTLKNGCSCHSVSDPAWHSDRCHIPLVERVIREARGHD